MALNPLITRKSVVLNSGCHTLEYESYHVNSSNRALLIEALQSAKELVQDLQNGDDAFFA